jgi:hypothetical protein
LVNRWWLRKLGHTWRLTSWYVLEREPPESNALPQAGPVSGRAVAKDNGHIAIATAANSFFVIASTFLGRDVQVGERLSLRFHQGRVSIDNGRDRGRGSVRWRPGLLIDGHCAYRKFRWGENTGGTVNLTGVGPDRTCTLDETEQYGEPAVTRVKAVAKAQSH